MEEKRCEGCGDIFLTKNPRRKICGQKCIGKFQKKRAASFAQSDAFREKFWGRVAILSEDECWAWAGAGHGNGYGSVSGSPSSARKCDFAHRVAYWLTHGSIPEGAVIRHTCDNKMCVNPKHLIAGTTLQNIQDEVERDRVRHGETHRSAKLSNEDILEIRASLLTHSELARKFNVSRTTILRARRGDTWRRVV